MGNAQSSRKISDQDRAILDMKVQRDQLQQYQIKIASIKERETQVAKQCLAKGQKDKALLALRRKKYQESLLTKTDQQLEQLQKLTSEIEFAAVQKDVLYGLKQGTAVLKQIHAEIGGIEGVEKLLEENEEARAYEKEVSAMLGGRMTNAEEDEVEDELEALEREVSGANKLPSAPAIEPLPDAPQTALEKRQQEKARAKAREEARQAADPIAA